MHSFPVRVYYEDTDLAGIVYYANYLKFIERGRSEWLRDLGIDQAEMKAAGVIFVVRQIQADYLSPARFDDQLEVISQIHALTPARVIMDQRVTRGDTVLFTARVTLVCLGPTGRPTRLPQSLLDLPGA